MTADTICERRRDAPETGRRRRISPKKALHPSAISVQLPKSEPELEVQSMTAWTPTEKSRKKQVMAGKTVVAHLRKDWRLIRWAKEQGLFARIDRMTPWGNIFVLDKDGDRDTVCDSYRTYIVRKPDLVEQLESLRGKVLGCHCYPKRCHGNELIEVLAERSQPLAEAGNAR
jgi:Domain of unknown function (DUF4326)